MILYILKEQEKKKRSCSSLCATNKFTNRFKHQLLNYFFGNHFNKIIKAISACTDISGQGSRTQLLQSHIGTIFPPPLSNSSNNATQAKKKRERRQQYQKSKLLLDALQTTSHDFCSTRNSNPGLPQATSKMQSFTAKNLEQIKNTRC